VVNWWAVQKIGAVRSFASFKKGDSHMDEEMKALISRLAEYLRMSEQQLRCFHKYESQVEGWFKGELLCFLDRERLEGRLPNFARERQVYYNDTQYILVDTVLQFDEADNNCVCWVELKHWIGYQKNQNWSPSWYFTNTARPAVERLLTIPEPGDKYMLVPFTPNPGSEEWDSGVDKFNGEFPALLVRSLTNPDDYPEFFFLGLLRVGR
jgi:hypothetical protein